MRGIKKTNSMLQVIYFQHIAIIKKKSHAIAGFKKLWYTLTTLLNFFKGTF